MAQRLSGSVALWLCGLVAWWFSGLLANQPTYFWLEWPVWCVWLAGWAAAVAVVAVGAIESVTVTNELTKSKRLNNVISCWQC